MRNYRTMLLFVACVVCAACNDSEKLTKEIQDAQSWIASARMVAKSHGDGAVPKAYAHDALQNFNQQLQSTAERIQSISDPRSAQAAATLQRAQQAVMQMDAGIARGDRLSLSQFDLQLDNEAKALATLHHPQTALPQKP